MAGGLAERDEMALNAEAGDRGSNRVSADRIESVFEAALDAITSALDTDRAAILINDRDGVMRFKAWRGISDEYRHAVEGHTPWTAGAPRPDPIIVPDVTTDAGLAPFHAAFAREKIRALAFVPLVSCDRTIGKFMLYWRTPFEPSPLALEAAQTIGAFLGVAVTRARQNAASVENERRMHLALQQEAETRERLARLAAIEIWR